jgi:hypothetical protein
MGTRHRGCLNRRCVECVREWQAGNRYKCAEYEARNPGREREYYWRTRDERLAYERAYWQRNPDKARECARRHRKRRAEHYRAYEARYRQENRGRCNA